MQVGELQDEARILQFLLEDPGFAVYAITDLDPPYRQYARYVGAEQDGHLATLLLVYTSPGSTSLLPFGGHQGLSAILHQVNELPVETYFLALEEDVPTIAERYDIDWIRKMLRMVVRPAGLRSGRPVDAQMRRLTMADLPDIQRLYADWRDAFLQPLMLEHGVFFGAYQRQELLAIAGTHTTSSRFRVGTIGGVFTRPDCRGRGLATATTAAVAEAMTSVGIELIGLNVRDDNQPAISAYHRLGFTTHMPFREGHASLRHA